MNPKEKDIKKSLLDSIKDRVSVMEKKKYGEKKVMISPDEAGSAQSESEDKYTPMNDQPENDLEKGSEYETQLDQIPLEVIKTYVEGKEVEEMEA